MAFDILLLSFTKPLSIVQLDTIAEIEKIDKEIERLLAKKESLSSQLLTFEVRKSELTYQGKVMS